MSGTREIELAIEGMTCAACAMRIEKKLNRLPDVLASVNYATATARVAAPAAIRLRISSQRSSGLDTGQPPPRLNSRSRTRIR